MTRAAGSGGGGRRGPVKKTKLSKYDEAVKIARQASARVKDPELRYVAFQKILEHILAKESQP